MALRFRCGLSVSGPFVCQCLIVATVALKLLYIGLESGDDVTLKRIAKGATSADHVEAAATARAAGLKQPAIFLPGVGGAERSVERRNGLCPLGYHHGPRVPVGFDSNACPRHAHLPAGRALVRSELPSVDALLRELRVVVAEASPQRSHVPFQSRLQLSADRRRFYRETVVPFSSRSTPLLPATGSSERNGRGDSREGVQA